MACKVLLADDSEIVRRAIRKRLSEHPDFEIVGETETFEERFAWFSSTSHESSSWTFT